MSAASWIWPRARGPVDVARNIGPPPFGWRYRRHRRRYRVVFRFRLAWRFQRGWWWCATCAFHSRWCQAFCRNVRNCRWRNHRILQRLGTRVRPTVGIQRAQQQLETLDFHRILGGPQPPDGAAGRERQAEAAAAAAERPAFDCCHVHRQMADMVAARKLSLEVVELLTVPCPVRACS